MANILAKHFQKSFSYANNGQNFDKNNEALVDRWYTDIFSDRDTPQINFDSNDQYWEILAKLKTTAPGHDLVNAKMIKSFPVTTHNYIINIMNYCLNNCYYPIEWKAGIILAFPKKDLNSLIPSNYRPITLIPVFGRILDKIIYLNLTEHIGKRIPKFQFGFMPNKSTVHPLAILVSNMQTTHLEGSHSCALFMDINKAFDSVWHKGILFKLWRLKTPKFLLYMVHEFLFERSLKLKVNNCTSFTFHPKQGVPQGSPLSPFLYNLFCHDIYSLNPNSFQKECYLLQYADDTVIVSHADSLTKAVSLLQCETTKVCNWFKKWRLFANPSKTILFLPYHKLNQGSPNIIMDQATISPSITCKYLGVWLDNKLNFLDHATKIKNSVTRRAGFFRSLTYKNDGIDTCTAVKIYKFICRPVLEYASVIVSNTKKIFENKISVAERTALRKLTKIRHPNNPLHNPSNDFLYETCSILPIANRLPLLLKKFASKKTNLNNIKKLCFKKRTRHAATNLKIQQYPSSNIYYPHNKIRQTIITQCVFFYFNYCILLIIMHI